MLVLVSHESCLEFILYIMESFVSGHKRAAVARGVCGSAMLLPSIETDGWLSRRLQVHPNSCRLEELPEDTIWLGLLGTKLDTSALF